MSLSAVVTFGYDARQRLISETRVVNQSTTVYDLAYTYDQLGNRLTKTDNVGDGWLTCYVYDTDWDADGDTWREGLCFTPASPEYDTRNNRLLEYREYPGDGQGGWLAQVRSVRYTYYKTGHVSNITIKDAYVEGVTPGDPDDYAWYNDLALYYATNDTLWRALWDKWQVDESGDVIPETYTKLAGREFFYDDGPQRYLARDLNVSDADPHNWTPTGDWLWTDYDRGRPYGDFLHSPGEEPVEHSRYLAEFGVHAQATLGEEGQTRYLHGDQVHSTTLTTDASGLAASTLAYTAFGEAIGDPEALATRYQYAGGWGYETGLLSLSGANSNLPPIALLHVGARWYHAATGRFIQRDPLGALGGLNAYVYCGADPTARVDPTGKMTVVGGAIVGGVIGGISGGILGGWRGAISGAIGGAVGGAVGAAIGPLGGFTVGGAVSGWINGWLNGRNPWVSGAGGAVTGFLGGVLCVRLTKSLPTGVDIPGFETMLEGGSSAISGLLGTGLDGLIDIFRGLGGGKRSTIVLPPMPEY